MRVNIELFMMLDIHNGRKTVPDRLASNKDSLLYIQSGYSQALLN